MHSDWNPTNRLRQRTSKAQKCEVDRSSDQSILKYVTVTDLRQAPRKLSTNVRLSRSYSRMHLRLAMARLETTVDGIRLIRVPQS